MTDFERKMLEGAYDLHIHFGPDVRPRKCDEYEMAERFAAVGMKGFAIKSHFTPTVERAILVNKKFPELNIVGGVALNNTVGGLNAMAVEAAGRLGGRFVWFPTMDAEKDMQRLKKNIPDFVVMENKIEEKFGKSMSVKVWDEDKELLPEVYEVLEIIRDYDMVLATGHLSPEEGLKVVTAAHNMGVRRIVITHADWKATCYSVEQQKYAVEQGAVIEHCFMTPSITYEDIAAQMKEVGPEHFYISTDLGAPVVPGGKDSGFIMSGAAPYADEGMAKFVSILAENGFNEDQIRTMTVKNPQIIAEK